MRVLGCGLLLLGCAAAEANNAPALRPNIIFNLVDDLGWNDVSWHREGGNIVKTPYLEGLASSGTKLQNYYIYRFCSPSRSTFMTGRHSAQYRRDVGYLKSSVTGGATPSD